ncbi:TadE/TadG family type IV pilus assembly protein [Hyphomonas pacifica]|uniref:TadE-like domain-containing protein n=1 Tax=Hyphomonas pacifica TaxID=1280941 RepID=A0A062TUS3_9PROT|nr:TadE/TadG family type IV pilus assembly protein [Hyphomonas pacifica]KCZ48361.1 hypothetical protein HY2_03930 [Hyphomonas pacifica]RAN31673.1 hypothetical protein HY3_03625 [Hyphomonas pacifica]RAN32066.1 hypothetical protein HY11_05690 [Hyphomonas pacifica]
MTIPFTILTARLQGKVEAWLQDRKGAAAVEFALVAIPFFFLIFGILEICLIFIMSTILEHSVGEAARKVRTGQAQKSGYTEVEFRRDVCNEFFDLLSCDNKLHIDVRSMSKFSSADMSTPKDADGNLDDAGFIFSPGGANEIVAVRVYYEWPLMTPVISAPLANLPNNRHLLQANAVFRNEPF